MARPGGARGLNWTEAVEAMRAGKCVKRPRAFIVLAIRKAPTPAGAIVEILTDPRFGYGGIKSLSKRQRDATDWHVCVVGIA